MNKLILITITILVVVVAIGAYYYTKSYRAPVQNAMPMQNQIPQNGNVPQNQNSAAANNVDIQNFAFNPATLTVKAGDTVTWTNNDSVIHQIKSDAFNSNQLSKGQTYSFTFQTAGTYDYSCSIHPSMKGQIIVQ